MKKTIIYLSLLSLISFSCEKDSEDDLIETPTDQTEKVTYDGAVKSIIDSNCISCHASPPVNGANTSLKTYEEVRALSDVVVERISRQPGKSGAMPPSGSRLPQSVIDTVSKWIADGLLEN